MKTIDGLEKRKEFKDIRMKILLKINNSRSLTLLAGVYGLRSSDKLKWRVAPFSRLLTQRDSSSKTCEMHLKPFLVDAAAYSPFLLC